MWQLLEQLDELLTVRVVEVSFGARTYDHPGLVVPLIVDFGTAWNHVAHLVKVHLWVVFLLDKTDILKLSDGCHYTKVEELVIRVVNAVAAVKV